MLLICSSFHVGQLQQNIHLDIKDSISFKRLTDYEYDNDLELIWIELNTVEGKILVCTFYRAPWQSDFWDKMEANIEFVKSTSRTQNMIILGDMNADFRTINGGKLMDLCRLHNLSYHITEPTRITETSRTCLDQILTNCSNFVSGSYVGIPVSESDHCTVSVKLDFRISQENPYTRFVWRYKDGDYDGLRSAIRSANWDECFLSDNIDVVCES